MTTQFQPMPAAMLVDVQAAIAANQKASPRIRRFEKNAQGRDFVVGDIHGAFSLVRRAMRLAQFDKAKDRLFSCGDLVDRGAESEVAPKFLASSFVHAVMGNHEHDLISVYAQNGDEGDDVEISLKALALLNWNGMRWLAQVTPEQRAEVVKAISKMPLVLEIETPRGLVGLIHGEVPIGMDWATFKQGILDGDEAITESCLSGRTRSKRACQDAVPGIDRLFCGHTPAFNGALRQGNVFFVDTGAVFSQMDGMAAKHPDAGLTMANLCFSTGLLATQGSHAHAQGNPGAVRFLGVEGVPASHDENSLPVPFNSSWAP